MLRKTSAVVLSALVALSLPVVATAGPIVVSGDASIAHALAGVDTPVDPGNEQFFANVLGGGTTVAVLETDVPFLESTDDWINDFYNGLAGVTSTVLAGAVTAADLAGVDLFVAPVPNDAFSAAELAALAAFLSGGGSIFFLGENDAALFAASNAAINAALTALGSSMQIVPDFFDPAFPVFLQATIAADPLTAGVGTFSYAAPSQVAGGTVLFSGSQGQPFVTYEMAQLPEPGVLALLAFGAGVALRRARGHRSRA